MNANGTAQTRLTINPAACEFTPAWSPDGTLIAYTVKRVDAYQVWVMKPTGQGKEQLVRSGQELWDYLPIWSQDGGTVYFNQRNLGPTRPWLMSWGTRRLTASTGTAKPMPM